MYFFLFGEKNVYEKMIWSGRAKYMTMGGGEGNGKGEIYDYGRGALEIYNKYMTLVICNGQICNCA